MEVPHSPSNASTSVNNNHPHRAKLSINPATSSGSLNDGLPCAHGVDEELSTFDLVRHCCESFDDAGDPINDFPHSLFMVSEWLMDNTELMAQLISLYQVVFIQYYSKLQ
jgi:hypothetical protein